MSDLANLGKLLASDPSETTWQALIQLFDGWRDNERLSAALEQAAARLSTWPDELRHIDLTQVALDRERPVWSSLVRSVKFKTNRKALPPNVLRVLSNPALTRLDLGYCTKVESLDFISGLPRLATLSLFSCKGLKNLDFLRGNRTLKTINLRDCSSLTTLDGLAGCVGFTALSLDHCKALTCVAGLKDLHNLREITFNHCVALEDVSPLASIGKLKRLGFCGCTSLKDLGPLAGLKHLQSLNLTAGALNSRKKVEAFFAGTQPGTRAEMAKPTARPQLTRIPAADLLTVADEVLSRAFATFPARWNAGASQTGIDRLRAAYGAKLPGALVDLLTLHDGSQPTMPIEGRGIALLSCARILHFKQMLDGLLERGEFNQLGGELWWHPSWLPFAAEANLNEILLIDCAGTLAGKPREVMAWSRTGVRAHVHKSFAKWLETYLVKLDAGVYTIDKHSCDIDVSRQLEAQKIYRRLNRGYPKRVDVEDGRAEPVDTSQPHSNYHL